MEIWNRRQAEIQYDWDVADFELEEVISAVVSKPKCRTFHPGHVRPNMSLPRTFPRPDNSPPVLHGARHSPSLPPPPSANLQYKAIIPLSFTKLIALGQEYGLVSVFR